MPAEVSTVADDLAVLHDGAVTHTYTDLVPATTYTFDGTTLTTLPRPPGALLCRFATVNDVHFGEQECGRIDDHPMGPILRVPPGARPYPEVMNAGAIAEIGAVDPAAVIVKGDLTADGTPEQFAAFRDAYGVFGERLHVVRGNHDAYQGQDEYAGDSVIDLPGVRVLLLDTTLPFQTTGRITPEQIEWLDTHAAESDRPVLVLGHHQNWLSGNRDPAYFGINPHDSDALVAVVARRRRVLAYAAGHTHRNRVRTRADAPGAVFVEVGCVKDFPGSWAEYRVYEGGLLQVHHRISTPEALAWSEQCRHLYRDFGVDYVAYALATVADRCFPLLPRDEVAA
jgi:3',5'-cyclic-AMP phosphodiesterase